MRVEVTKEDVVFKFFLFSVTIPKEGNDVEYLFADLGKTIGLLPLWLFIVPKKYKTSAFGKVWLYFYYYFTILHSSYDPIGIMIKSISSSRENYFLVSTLIIRGDDKIVDFINQLRGAGYDIDDISKKYDEIANAPIEQKFISGTQEWKKDRFLLFAVIPFVIFELVFSLIFFSGTNLHIATFAKVTLILALFFYGFFRLITIRK